MIGFDGVFLLGGLLLFVSVLASTLSARLGLPLLLLFLFVGMLAGEEGVGNIVFHDFSLAMLVGQLALAVILLDGGLRTKIATFRVALWPATVLATWGVVGTVALLAVFATWWLDVDWQVGLLFAAIVGSTDAAAVFSLLRNSGVRLNDRVKATLEIESGANDPMAILLVTVVITMLSEPGQTGLLDFLRLLVVQAGLGAAIGYGAGTLLALLLARLRLAEGLYALLIASGGLMIFAATNSMGGSGFLAIYLAGLVIGNRRCHATEHVLRVMDGLAWLSQAGMFLVLGLLVTPSHLIEYGLEALAMACFLMLVARPVAVAVGLWPFNFSRNEILYISWVGLRGAVPIVLAIFPVMAGVENSLLIFDVAFAVVLVSLLVQGTTVPWMAHKLGVVVPPRDEPDDRIEIWVSGGVSLELLEYRVARDSRAEGHHPYDLLDEIGGEAVRCVALVRDGARVSIDVGTRLRPADGLWLAAPESLVGKLAKAFVAGQGNELTAHAGYFGEFVVDPDGNAGELAAAYGFSLGADEAGLTLARLFEHRLERPAVFGDKLTLGSFILTVREMDGERIVGMGLKCPSLPLLSQ